MKRLPLLGNRVVTRRPRPRISPYHGAYLPVMTLCTHDLNLVQAERTPSSESVGFQANLAQKTPRRALRRGLAGSSCSPLSFRSDHTKSVSS